MIFQLVSQWVLNCPLSGIVEAGEPKKYYCISTSLLRNILKQVWATYKN